MSIRQKLEYIIGMIRHILYGILGEYMLRNRYIFLRRIYGDYVILFLVNSNRYVVMGRDFYIHYFFNGKNLIKYFKKWHINYIVIDNLVMVDKVSYDDNGYNLFFYKAVIIRIVKNRKLVNFF